MLWLTVASLRGGQAFSLALSLSPFSLAYAPAAAFTSSFMELHHTLLSYCHKLGVHICSTAGISNI